jgi:hypothetical protein
VLKGYHHDADRKLAFFEGELQKLDAAAAPASRQQYPSDSTIRQLILVQRSGPEPMLEPASSAAAGLAKSALRDVVKLKRQAVTSLMAEQLTPPPHSKAPKP